MSSIKTIGEQLSTLLKLQEVDAKIYAHLRSKKMKPLELEGIRLKREGQLLAVQSAEKRLSELQLHRKEKEMDLEAKEGTIKKYQIQLYQVKTNKEYQSLQKEIEGLKADNSVLEEEILHLMEEVDREKSMLTEQKGILSSLEGELKREGERIQREIEAIDQDLVHFKEKREEMIPELDRKLLERYDKILLAKEGVALVPIEGNSCSGCHMSLPPQVINEVQLQEKLVTCESCSRILYDRGGSVS